jgi:hypothetical protein
MDINSEYIGKTLSLPKELDPKKKKEAAYVKQVAEAIYSMHVNNATGIVYNMAGEFTMLREYGNADQSEELYKKYFIGETTVRPSQAATAVSDVDGLGGYTQTPTAKRKGYMNILWDVIGIAPKIKSAFIGKFQNAEYDVVATPIDPTSGAEMETEKYGLWMIRENMEFLSNATKRMGLEWTPPSFIPESMEALDMYYERGGFKPVHAMASEMLINHTLDISDWKVIKDKMIEDGLNVGVYGSKTYFDEEVQKFRIRYVDPDPEKFVIQQSKYNDFRDSEFAGEIIEVSIGWLRRVSDLNEEAIQNIARKYCEYKGNPPANMFEKHRGLNEADGSYGYDFYRVRVFDFEWIEMDGSQKMILTNQYGKSKVIEQDYGTTVKEDKDGKRKVVKDKQRNKYVGMWVVGTEYVFNHGKAYDMLRPDKYSVALSYHMYKLQTKSITKQLKPLYDNFAILWYKYQNAISTAAMRGYVINMSSIQNITLGGDKVDERQVLKRFVETGILFFKETTVMGNKNTSIRPVFELPGGMGDIFREIQEGFRFNIQMVESLTGINPLALGTVDPNAPVKTSEMGVENTQDVMRPLLSGYLAIKEMVAKNTVLWMQLKIKNSPDVAKAYEAAIGKKQVAAFKMATGHSAKYGIRLEAQPTSLEKKEIYESAKIALANGRDGKPGINEADFFMILSMMKNNSSLKLAEMVLEAKISKSKRESDAMAKENMRIQSEAAQQLEMGKHEMKIKEINAEADKEVRVALAKGIIDIYLKIPAETEAASKIEAMKREMASVPSADNQQQGAQQPQPQAVV